MDSNDRWMKTGTFDFYDKIQDMIELDFDLDSLKYENKKASLFEKICSCFNCCFRCTNPRKENNNHYKHRNSINKLMNEFEDNEYKKDDDAKDDDVKDDDEKDEDVKDDDNKDDDVKDDDVKDDDVKDDDIKDDDIKDDNDKRQLFSSVINYNLNNNKKKNNTRSSSLLSDERSSSKLVINSTAKGIKKAQVRSISDKIGKNKRIESVAGAPSPVNLDYLIQSKKALIRSEAYLNGYDSPDTRTLDGTQDTRPGTLNAPLKNKKNNIELTEIKIN